MPGIDNWAHLGGFLVGILTGSGLTPATLTSTRFGFRQMTHGKDGTQTRNKLAKSAMLGLSVLLIALVLILANNKSIIDRI